MRSVLGRFASATALLIAGAAAAAPVALTGYGADAKRTTVSGLSSGGYMAVQLQIAYSASFVGAGVVAGGPYYCAQGIALFALFCMGEVPPAAPGASTMVGAAKAAASTQEIDSLANLKHRRVYVFSGKKDDVVLQAAVDATVDALQQLGVAGTRMKYVNDLPAGHAFIAPGVGNACDANAAPYISHCLVAGKDYDQAGEILQHLYAQPALHAPAALSSRAVVAFDQRPFGSAAALMADTGFVYVPQACEAAGARCRVHVALHGCAQSAESVGNLFTSDTGYNRWADTNKIVVLYPQVDKSVLMPNPQGCWDWWGYTGGNYAYKSAPQMKAIMAMVKRLAQKP